MPNTFHIRDAETGMFYERYLFHGHWAKPPCSLSYADKGFGKSFKELGKVKIHLLYLIGNMDPPKHIREMTEQTWGLGREDPRRQQLQDEIDAWHALHPGYNDVPEVMSNTYPLDTIPSSWEVVEVTDKKKKEWTKVDLNPSAYVEEAQKLRRLTDTYGSAVRDIYKKIEKSKKQDEMPWVAAVMLDPAVLIQNSSNWWDWASVDPTPVDEALKRMGTKRSNMVRSTKKESVAIAFRTQEEAFFFKMCYDGVDQVGILDMAHLAEVVDTPS